MRSRINWIGNAATALLVLSAVGCGDDGMPTGPGDGGMRDGDIGDGGPDAAPGDGGGMGALSIEEITATESASSVLVWRLSVRTDAPATVRVDVEPGGDLEGWSIESDDEPAEEHELILAGLRAETTYDLTVEATDAEGANTTDSSESFTTAALPSEMPPLEVGTSEPSGMADGYTLFNVFRWPAGENAVDEDTGWLIVVDSAGEVVWYAILDHRTHDAQLLPNGNLIYLRPHEEIREIDVTGELQRSWTATALLDEEAPDDTTGVDADTFHHEVEMLPNGNLLALSSEMREITTAQCPNYEPSSGDSLNVVGDVVVEFDPDSGEVVQRISMFDELDPCRRTDRGFSGGFWDSDYGGITTQDWTHGNAAFYDESRGIVVTSLRHSDWIVAFDYVPGDGSMAGDVAWILGAEGEEGDYTGHPSFMPTGDDIFQWQYHQHAPMFTSDGTLLVYDNGNLRPETDFDPDDEEGDADLPYTRVVEYGLDASGDPSSYTVEQHWQWLDPEGQYAPFVGDADELENGNVLFTNGGLLEPPSDGIRDPENKKLARIIEIDRENDEMVFELTIQDEASSDFVGYSVYRADRITGFPR